MAQFNGGAGAGNATPPDLNSDDHAPKPPPKGWKRYLWPAIGGLAIVISFWLLAKELRGLSWSDLWAGIEGIRGHSWLLICLSTLGCYVTLGLYDAMALAHLRKKLSFVFVSLCALTTYALAHTIGASAFTGAVIRYRAYTAKGLSGAEVGVLVTFCTLTFVLGVMVMLGLVFLFAPDLELRLHEHLPEGLLIWAALVLWALVALYVLASFLRLPPLKIRGFSLFYPRPDVTLRQVLVAPTELLFASAIFYFALPELGNPGYLTVMAVFVIAFSLALLSHAPGGLGVFELAMITGLPEFPPETVLAALIVFRIFYFLIPLAIGLVLVAGFERERLRETP